VCIRNDVTASVIMLRMIYRFLWYVIPEMALSRFTIWSSQRQTVEINKRAAS
jgi:hypothetical protein